MSPRARHEENSGGTPFGYLGPVAEGLIAWPIGIGGLFAVIYSIGTTAPVVPRKPDAGRPHSKSRRSSGALRSPSCSLPGKSSAHDEGFHMALAMREVPQRDDDDAILRLSLGAPGWRFEFEADGTMLVSPTFSDGGPRDVEAAVQLRAFAARAGGKVFGSSAGFRLPDGSLRSPDAAWISEERLAGLSPEDRTKFWRVCPDVVIEILSSSDSWSDLVHKIESYVLNGAIFAIAIDPFGKCTEMRGVAPAHLQLDPDAIARA